MTRAVILAGGKGERLAPLTWEIPKVLIPFRGKPLLDQPISLFWNYDVYEIWLSVGHMFDQILDKYPFPFIPERILMGTAGWLRVIKNRPESIVLFDEDFYVCNGDNLLNVDLKEMMEFHKRNGNVATIACVKIEDTREYGSVSIKEGKITRFREKVQSPKPKKGYINSGYYILSPEVFDWVPDQDHIMFEKDIFPKLARAGKLGAFKVDFKDKERQWFDTGTFERYQAALEKWDGIK